MLAFAEGYLARIRNCHSDSEIISVLSQLARELGYRSGFLIEYAKSGGSAHILDTNSDRATFWQVYTRAFGAGSPFLGSGWDGRNPLYITEDHYIGPFAVLLPASRKNDMSNVATTAVSFDEEFVGVVALCGERILNAQEERAIQLIAYTMFSQTRSFRSSGVVTAPMGLTPREREVIELSAEGLTSQEVADQLGVSPRTVNQHVDNVALKLGTKNRVHTVAEAIRRYLV